MPPKPESAATSNVYVNGVDPVEIPLLTVSVTGCCTFLKCAPSSGDTGCGAPIVTPVLASVTVAAVGDAALVSDGVAGLDFSHAAAASERTNTLQTGNDFRVIQLLEVSTNSAAVLHRLRTSTNDILSGVAGKRPRQRLGNLSAARGMLSLRFRTGGSQAVTLRFFVSSRPFSE